METEIRVCPKWHSTLCFLVMLGLFQANKAEINCRSCHTGDKWRAHELLLKFDTRESAVGLKGEVLGQGDGTGRSGAAGAGAPRLRCSGPPADCAPELEDHTELTRSTDNLRADGHIGERQFAKMKVSHVKMSDQHNTGEGAASAAQYRRRTRRTSDDKRVQPGSTASQDPEEGISPAAGRRVTRSELRWSEAERRAAGARQEELKVNSSTFALTGDSSHNQAMVHWSGHNSSVSDLLCPLYAPLATCAHPQRRGAGAQVGSPPCRGRRRIAR